MTISESSADYPQVRRKQNETGLGGWVQVHGEWNTVAGLPFWQVCLQMKRSQASGPEWPLS